MASRSYICRVVRTIGIRELKNKLSACLRDVEHGDIYLVSDRGRVVAELKKPGLGVEKPILDPIEAALHKRVLLGKATPPTVPLGEGMKKAEAMRPKGLGLTSEQIAEALNWTRGDR